MREVDTAVEASKNIVLPEAEAAQLAMLKATTDPEVCVTTAKQYLKTIERRHECSVLSDRAILRLSGLDPDSMDAPDHLYALFRTLPLQTVSKSSPEHTVLTALTRSLCAPPESDEVAHVNIDLIGVYLATLAEAVQNGEPAVASTCCRSQRTDLAAAAFRKALQQEPRGRPTQRSIQGEALSHLLVAGETPRTLIEELESVLTQVRDESPDAYHRQMAAEIIEHIDTNTRDIAPDQATLDRDW